MSRLSGAALVRVKEDEDSIVGSQFLKEAIDKAVFRFGFKHRISTDEARHLLLNTGVRL